MRFSDSVYILIFNELYFDKSSLNLFLNQHMLASVFVIILSN